MILVLLYTGTALAALALLGLTLAGLHVAGWMTRTEECQNRIAESVLAICTVLDKHLQQDEITPAPFDWSDQRTH